MAERWPDPNQTTHPIAIGVGVAAIAALMAHAAGNDAVRKRNFVQAQLRSRSGIAMATQKARSVDAGDGPVSTGASTAKAVKNNVIDIATRNAIAKGAKLPAAEPASTGNAVRDQYREMFGKDPARGKSFAQMRLDLEFAQSHQEYRDTFGKSAGNMSISKVRAAVAQAQAQADYKAAFGEAPGRGMKASGVAGAVEAHREYVDVFGENPKNQRAGFFGKTAPPTAESMHAQIARSNSMSAGWGGSGRPPSRAYMAGNGVLAAGIFASGAARAIEAKKQGASGAAQAGQFAIGAGNAAILPAAVATGLGLLSKSATLGKYVPTIGKGLLPVSMALSAAAYGGKAYSEGKSGWEIASRTLRGAVNGALPLDIGWAGVKAVQEMWSKPATPSPSDPASQPTSGRQPKLTSTQQQDFRAQDAKYRDDHMGHEAGGGGQDQSQAASGAKSGLVGFQHAKTQAAAQKGKAAKRGGTYNGPDPSEIDASERAQRAGA